MKSVCQFRLISSTSISDLSSALTLNSTYLLPQSTLLNTCYILTYSGGRMAEDKLNSFNQDNLIECFTKQLSELELFQTMYTPREIVITNTEVLDEIRNFIEKKSVFTPNHLDYTIIQHVEKLKLEISIHLPSIYPEIIPEVYVRCNHLNRHQEKSLNTDLTAYLQSKYDEEVCIYTAILWLQDNAEQYAVKTPEVCSNKNSVPQEKFSRYWIYSHHIYSKKKTEEISKLSKELRLNGFCLLGKPGVICVEGNEEDCKEWWKMVKALHWQKIALRITESFDHNERPKQIKFKNFDILSFPSATGHSDLGSLQKYMLKYGLLDQLNEFFSVHSS